MKKENKSVDFEKHEFGNRNVLIEKFLISPEYRRFDARVKKCFFNAMLLKKEKLLTDTLVDRSSLYFRREKRLNRELFQKFWHSGNLGQ